MIDEDTDCVVMSAAVGMSVLDIVKVGVYEEELSPKFDDIDEEGDDAVVVEGVGLGVIDKEMGCRAVTEAVVVSLSDCVAVPDDDNSIPDTLEEGDGVLDGVV